MKVSGYPEPEIIWSKDRHVMTDDELNGIITDRGALIFPAVTIENQGTVRYDSFHMTHIIEILLANPGKFIQKIIENWLSWAR